MEQTPIALLLAGGFATRLWPLTEKRAKPLLPLAGKQLISHIIDRIPPQIPIVISTNLQFQDAFDKLKKVHSDRDIQVFFEDSDSDKSKVGALGATALVIERFGITSPLLLIAGDNYFGFDMKDFLDSYQDRTILASYDTKSLHLAKQFGVLGVEGNRLVTFVEKPEDPPSTLISTGCYLFEPDHLAEISHYAHIASDNLGGIFEHLLKKEADIDVFAFDQEWIDIGSFESYLYAHRSLLSENRIHESSEVTNTELGSAVEVGSDCQIVDSSLDEVIIMEGCTIRNARLRSCIIDKHSVIEGVDLDHKMIREGSVIRG